MERIVYNTLLGAKPIQEDGSSFYYSDYHHAGFKTYKRVIPGATYAWDLDDKWPCCSGTLPQAVADYGINSYLRNKDGVYINLYHPSRAAWTHDSARCSITQTTDYPRENLIALNLAVSAPALFTVYLRIPAWSGKNTSVAVNGRRLHAELVPGTFFPIRRPWKTADRIELEIDQPLRFEPVDAQTQNQVAIVRGPQVLFAIQTEQPRLSRHELDNPSLRKASANDWSMQTATGALTLRPFGSIGNEIYHTYSAVA